MSRSGITAKGLWAFLEQRIIRWCAIGGVLVLLLRILAAQAQVTVSVYRVFETQITNTKSYANPFRDVTLTATFHAPSGKQIAFWGFYDGDGNGGPSGNVWRLRFMPDELGTWTYTYSWTDGTPGSSGSFLAVNQDAGKGILQPYSLNPRWLAYNGVTPVMFRSYYVGKMTNTPLDWSISHVYQPLIDRGYNHILYLASLNNDYDWITHKWGDAPAGLQVQPGYANDINLQAWKLAESHFMWLNDRNVAVDHWTGLGGNNWWNLSGADKEFYIRYVMSRLAPLANNAGWGFSFEQVAPSDFMDLVIKYDPWSHLRGGQNKYDLYSFTQPTYTWMAQSEYKVQFTGASIHDRTLAIWNKLSPKMPLYMSENTLWHGQYETDEDTLRQLGWGVTMAGGLFDWNWAMTEDAARPELTMSYNLFNSNADEYFDILYRVFTDEVNLGGLVPHDELISNRAASTYCLAEIGMQYVVFDQDGGQFALQLATGNYSGVWIDAKTGARQAVDSVTGGETA